METGSRGEENTGLSQWELPCLPRILDMVSSMPQLSSSEDELYKAGEKGERRVWKRVAK